MFLSTAELEMFFGAGAGAGAVGSNVVVVLICCCFSVVQKSILSEMESHG
jgi:hypothetical protein